MNFFLCLGLILAVGGALGCALQRLRLPSFLGYMALGIALGNLGLMNPELGTVSAELRKIALIIILLKAGLSLEFDDLRRVGRPAVLLSVLPCCMEMCAVGIAGHFLLGLSYTESFLLGAVLGAVSPAVVVPRTARMIDEQIGTAHGIPQMIIAGSSMDDIVMIVFYTAFLSAEGGGEISARAFLNIPVSILTGILVGILFGLLFAQIFRRFHLRDSLKLTFLLGTGFLLVYLESALEGVVGYSGLLSVIAMGITLLRLRRAQAVRLKAKCDRLWVVGELFLFTLVGAAIPLRYALAVLGTALLTILVGLIFRNIGVQLALLGTGLSVRERLFVSISYLPKATVQAAIGGGLLDLGNQVGSAAMIAAGSIVLSAAVVAILVTAPVGAALMDATCKQLLCSHPEK